MISIIQFVDQHRLGPTWRLLDEHQLRDDAGRVIGYRALDRIGQTLAPVMLRRRKAEVLTQLPERVDQRIFVPLTPQQRVHHDENGAILEAGAALLQGLASARSAGGAMPGTVPITIERDPVTGQASVRLPLPEPAVLQRLARAFEPWLKS